MFSFKPTSFQRKLIVSAVFLILVVLSATALIDRALNKTVFGAVDDIGVRYLDDTLKRSVYTYAVVRGLNGVISVIQGTDLAVSPAGVGVRLAVGEILDPVNDLVERFSWIMLISTASLGIQKLLLEIGVWVGIRYLLSGSLMLFLIGIWLPKDFFINFKRIGLCILALAVFIRICIPLSGLLNEQIYERFLKEKYDQSISSLESISSKVEEISLLEPRRQPDRNAESLIDTILGVFSGSMEGAGLKQKLMSLKDNISDYAHYIVNLIIVFILQTIVLPVVVLWALSRILFHPWTHAQ